MRYQFYREHKYVSAALNDLERLIARADFCDPAAMQEVKEAFSSLGEMLKGHAHYENERLHTLLKEKNSSVSMHAEEDHESQDRQLLEIEQMIHGISVECEQEKKIQMGYQLYLTFRQFVADNLTHLHEEETQILPELQRLYSDSELQQVEAQTYREMPPEHIIGMLGALFPHMNTYDRQALLLDILSLEPEKFDVVWKEIQSIIAPTEQAAIELALQGEKESAKHIRQ